MVKFKRKSRDAVIVLAFSLLISTTLGFQGNWTLDKSEGAQLLHSPPTRLHELYSATTGTNTPHKFNTEPVPVSTVCLHAIRDVLAGNYTNALLVRDSSLLLAPTALSSCCQILTESFHILDVSIFR